MSLEKGARTLIIWDINEANIASTVEEFKSIGNVKGYRVDVSDSDKVVETAALTQKECGNVDIVINCAGIVTSNATFDKLGIKEIEPTIEINATAPMIIAQQFLPR
jgi:all-trans-retinol dehydrogenase (NAD+)